MMRCTFHMMGGFRIDLDRLNLTEKILSNTLADEKAVFEMRPNAGGMLLIPARNVLFVEIHREVDGIPQAPECEGTPSR
jgi:hypothetical protein